MPQYDANFGFAALVTEGRSRFRGWLGRNARAFATAPQATSREPWPERHEGYRPDDVLAITPRRPKKASAAARRVLLHRNIPALACARSLARFARSTKSKNLRAGSNPSKRGVSGPRMLATVRTSFALVWSPNEEVIP